MGPDELDDLMASIRAESKRESALALYEGTREDDLVSEEVDERVLGLLGLEDVFDIDYGTYISLLKERLVSSRNFDKKLSSEEDELLVSEFKKVKGKVGRFKLKRKKVTADEIGVTGPIRVSQNKFLLAGKAVIPEREATESSSDIVDIQKALDSILKTLTLQNKDKKKASEDERKKSEDRRRRTREGELEKPLTQLKSLAQKIIAPEQGILDRIFRFIKFTLLGYAFNQLIKWFNDPKNAEKVKVLGRFLKDWWPALLSAYVLFATPFGKFVRVTLKMLRGFIPQILKIVPQLARFAVANPVTTAAAAATVGGIVKIKESERLKPVTQKSQEEIDKTLQSKETPWYQKLGASFAGQSLNAPGGPVNPIGLSAPGGMYSGGGLVKPRSFFGGGLIQKEIDARDIAFEGGGGISEDTGVKIKGAGVDTQLIAARPGEVVMSKEAVDKYGSNFFLDLNRRGGGTNVPRMVNNIQLASGGGIIRKTIKSYQGGGILGSLGKVLPGTGRVMAPQGMNLGYQNKFLGMNIGGVKNLPLNQTYSPDAVKRYNASSNAPSSLVKFGTGPLAERSVSIPKSSSSKNSFAIPPSSVSRPPMSKPPTDLNLNLKQNIQTIRDASNRQEKMMRELGVEPDGYVNLRGQPLNLGPQSRSMAPPGPPVIYTKTTYTVLPPIKAPSKASANISRGSKLPEFSASSNSDPRSKIASALGIADLVGVA
jgi:hypothetical protein